MDTIVYSAMGGQVVGMTIKVGSAVPPAAPPYSDMMVASPLNAALAIGGAFALFSIVAVSAAAVSKARSIIYEDEHDFKIRF